MLIYKIIHKLYALIFKNYIKSQVIFNSTEAKKSFVVDTGVKIYNPNVKIGKNVHLYHNVIIFGDGPVIIGDNTRIGYNTIIYSSSNNGGVLIGKQCAIAANTYIIDTNHSTKIVINKIKKEDDVSKVIKIGDNVWIGASCVIAKGTELGNNVIIGANSFVNKNIPTNAIVAGSPAKIIKYRN